MATPSSKAKHILTVTDEMEVKVFGDSMAYEILYSLGVPLYDLWDYSRWEYTNFTRATHARLLCDFFEGKGVRREAKKEESLWDGVMSSDYGFDLREDLLPKELRESLNRRLIHFSYSRTKVDPRNRAWDDRILGNLLGPVVDFMKHILARKEYVTFDSTLCLFRSEACRDEWRAILEILESGRELVHWSWIDPEHGLHRHISWGRLLPDGKPQFTRTDRISAPPNIDRFLQNMRSYSSK
jgi:hypothetical protein